mmetsp:Transcript_26871/g.74057  ORF Transcript_26871/g.74057 Transcript_26871/m.74057 type:complete len:85 (+) Transcript_26871:1642-1896(+)
MEYDETCRRRGGMKVPTNASIPSKQDDLGTNPVQRGSRTPRGESSANVERIKILLQRTQANTSPIAQQQKDEVRLKRLSLEIVL